MCRLAHARTVLFDYENFESRMAVSLADRSRFHEAAAFARSDQMTGRTFLHSPPNGHARWEFEHIEDGILFRLRFNGSTEKPMNFERYLSGEH